LIVPTLRSVPSTSGYSLTFSPVHVRRDSDGFMIPFDKNNRDYAAYLQWLAEGNTPTPYTGPAQPTAPTSFPTRRVPR
jgi:hypothetical protein